MKIKFKLRSNRRGAGILGVMRAGLCREVTGIAVVVLGPKRALPHLPKKRSKTGALFHSGCSLHASRHMTA
jgi:hypothetical protein